MHVTDANRWLEGGPKDETDGDGGRHWTRNPAALWQKGREERSEAAKPHNQWPKHAVKFVKPVAMLQ